MKSYEELRALASDAAQAVNASAAGVAVTVESYSGDMFFAIWSINTRGLIESARLDCGCTDRTRLEAHIKGFAQNHLDSWAAFEQEKLIASRKRASAAFAGWGA